MNCKKNYVQNRRRKKSASKMTLAVMGFPFVDFFPHAIFPSFSFALLVIGLMFENGHVFILV